MEPSEGNVGEVEMWDDDFMILLRLLTSGNS